MIDFLDKGIDSLLSLGQSISDSIVSGLVSAISNLIGLALYGITWMVCEIIHAVYSVFGVFSGISTVQWKNKPAFLIDVFFQNKTVTGIYWGMVIIGIVLVFGFAIVAVIRKVFDLNDKHQASIGQILGSSAKSIFIMVILTLVLSLGTTLTNVLVTQVNYVFNKGDSLLEKNEIQFTDEQFATMARILNTIGIYSLIPGYSHRFNLNSCYNEIRPDLLYLQKQGVFEFYYPTENADGDASPTWQSVLQQLVQTASPTTDLKMDPYYEEVCNSLLSIMDTMRTNSNFFPLEQFKRENNTLNLVSLDRVVFLSGTMHAAKNDIYNKEPDFEDGLRSAFYSGERSIYSLDDVSSSFDIGLGGISYILIWFTAYFVLKNLVRCIMSCAARIANMLGLYLVSPPVVAAMPLDDGQKFKEWTTSMTIQMLGIFGNIIPMRLVVLMVPIIMDSDLVLLPSTTLNVFAKVLLLLGAMEAVSRFDGLLTGILANNAGGQAIHAMNLSEMADKGFNHYFGRFIPGVGDDSDPNGDRKAAQQDRKAQQQRQQEQDALPINSGAGYSDSDSLDSDEGGNSSALPSSTGSNPSVGNTLPQNQSNTLNQSKSEANTMQHNPASSFGTGVPDSSAQTGTLSQNTYGLPGKNNSQTVSMNASSMQNVSSTLPQNQAGILAQQNGDPKDGLPGSDGLSVNPPQSGLQSALGQKDAALPENKVLSGGNPASTNVDLPASTLDQVLSDPTNDPGLPQNAGDAFDSQ